MRLEYDVIFSDRKTLTVSVERDRSVVVRAPNGTTAGCVLYGGALGLFKNSVRELKEIFSVPFTTTSSGVA
jgi:hypothetical protein